MILVRDDATLMLELGVDDEDMLNEVWGGTPFFMFSN